MIYYTSLSFISNLRQDSRPWRRHSSRHAWRDACGLERQAGGRRATGRQARSCCDDRPHLRPEFSGGAAVRATPGRCRRAARIGLLRRRAFSPTSLRLHGLTVSGATGACSPVFGRVQGVLALSMFTFALEEDATGFGCRTIRLADSREAPQRGLRQFTSASTGSIVPAQLLRRALMTPSPDARGRRPAATPAQPAFGAARERQLLFVSSSF